MTKAGYVMAAQFCLQQLFAKLSILALFYRFFFVDVKFVRAVYAVGAVQVVWSIVTYMLHWFECTPPAKLWTPKMKGSCLNAPAFLAAGESINSVVDFVIVGLAIYMVQHLHLKTAVKAKLAILFGLGSLYVAALPILPLHPHSPLPKPKTHAHVPRTPSNSTP
jgi:hypothetical protein